MRERVTIPRATVPLLNVADGFSTWHCSPMLSRGFRAGNPLAAALCVHGGFFALAKEKVLEIAIGLAICLVTYHLWPRMTLYFLVVADLIAAAAVADNLFWPLHH